MSTFTSIQTAMSGLQAHQAAMEVIGQNVTNINTPGYHRQEAVLQSLPGVGNNGPTQTTQNGQFGTGVEVTTVRQFQDRYIQQQMQTAEGQLGYWQTANTVLQQVQGVLSPDATTTLSTQLDNFYSSWQQLAAQPDQAGVRDGVRSAAVLLTNNLNTTSQQLTDLNSSLTTQMQSQVDHLNSLSDQLATLNTQIGMAQSQNSQPNDLLDQRTQIMNEMSNLVGASSMSSDTGYSVVSLGGRSLVQGGEANHVQLTNGAGGPQLTWSDGSAADATNGELGGLMELRTHIIPNYQNQLDSIAFALSSAVNSLHTTGVTAQDTPAGTFFTGSTANAIHVSDAILSDSDNIAATTTTGTPGDGSLATAIAGIKSQALIGAKTLSDSAQGMLGLIGNAVSSAKTSLTANTSLYQQLTTQEQAVSGVSLDEEMTNMLVSQRAYDASARVLSIADEMLKTLIQSIG